MKTKFGNDRMCVSVYVDAHWVLFLLSKNASNLGIFSGKSCAFSVIHI